MKLSRMLIATVLMGTFALSSPMTALNAAYAAPPRMGGPGRGPGGPGGYRPAPPRHGPGGPGGYRPAPPRHGPGGPGGFGHGGHGYRPAPPPPPRHKHKHNDALAVGGALLFLGSDIILILNTFGGQSRESLRISNIVLYYIGQLLIAASLQFV